MLNKLFKVDKRLIITLFIMIMVIINYFYYTFFYKAHYRKLKKIKKKYELNLKNINLETLNFKKNIIIFNRLKKIKRKLEFKKMELELLKKNAKNKEDILAIIKTLIIESKINLKELRYTGRKKQKNLETISFNLSGRSKLKNFVEFLDLIENKNNILLVDNFKLTNKKDKKNLDIIMNIKSIFLSVNEKNEKD